MITDHRTDDEKKTAIGYVTVTSLEPRKRGRALLSFACRNSLDARNIVTNTPKRGGCIVTNTPKRGGWAGATFSLELPTLGPDDDLTITGWSFPRAAPWYRENVAPSRWAGRRPEVAGAGGGDHS